MKVSARHRCSEHSGCGTVRCCTTEWHKKHKRSSEVFATPSQRMTSDDWPSKDCDKAHLHALSSQAKMQVRVAEADVKIITMALP